MPVNHEHIAQLIFKHFTESLSGDEQQTLDQWMNENEENRLFMNSLEDGSELVKQLRQVEKDKNNNTEAILYERIVTSIECKEESLLPPQPVFTDKSNIKIAHRIHFLKTAWLRYAAAIIILVTGIVVYYFINYKPTIAPTKGGVAKTEDILPGSEKAILTLSNGKKIELNNTASETITDGASSIKNNSGQLTYLPIPSVGGVLFNTMTTPPGGQYKLTLSDGTRVWLNAASSITYPTVFATNSRNVKITGEAYFEVKANFKKPFIVKTTQEEIIVLGTAFNVNSYTDEPSTKTSLITGSIKIDNKILKPGQAFTNGKIIQTNIPKDIAWKNGYFSFEDADIQMVMRQISRWYNVNVIYRGEIPKTEINGDIGRTLTLSQLLKVLKNLRINYTVEKNTIIIYP